MTLAIVDDSTSPGSGGWDPADPAAVQLADGSCGVAYTDAASPAAHTLYRRYLGTQDPPYWLDAVTVDTGASSADTPVPAMVEISGTLALFYRKATSGVKQVFLRTSTDYGKTWSSATQVITNSTVGQAIGPLQSSTYPNFDIKKLASGSWLLAWLNVSQCTGHSYCNNYSYPVLWTATSSDLGSASWSNKQEVTLAYDDGFFNARYGANHPAIAQTGSGTVYLGYTFFWMYWDRYGYYRTSTDSGATWSSETVYAYEPTRGTQGSQGVTVQNVYLAVDNNGSIRSFWDQSTADGWSSNPDNYPTQLFRRDLPSGAIIPISAVKEALSQCSVCVPWAAFGADPVNLTTGNFTLPETDIAIPARGPGLALDDFDIYAAAGGRNLAVDRSFAVTVTDGILNVTFGRVTDNPIISAIEVVWAGAAPATPLVTYAYRGDGLRNSKTVTTTSTITYTWDVNSSLPEVLQDGTYSYVYGLGGLISQTDGSGNQTYFLHDGLDSIRELTNGSGTGVSDYFYDAFGADRGSAWSQRSTTTDYHFNGQYDDSTLGLYYLRARYYDPIRIKLRE